MIFDKEEIDFIAEKLFRKGRWRQFHKFQEAVVISRYLIPVFSCVNSEGIPCSPILRDFLGGFDPNLYVEFFTQNSTGKEMLGEMPEVIRNKILASSLT